MRPLRDNILVKQLKKEQLGKVIVPDSVQDDWYKGRVVAVGPGVFAYGQFVPSDVKVGDTVIFPPPYGESYPVVCADGVECIILPEKLIWAVESE